MMTRVAARCLRGFGVEGLLAASDLVNAGESLRAWVSANFPGAAWYTELPVTAPRPDSGQWLGTIDLLLLLPNGKVVIIDHKSAPIQKKHCQAKAGGYSGQIAAYRQALGNLGFSVHAAYVHFPLAGAMAKIG
jgi:ATP-dependent exoDNAse (exonuclease V) beta subunit